MTRAPSHRPRRAALLIALVGVASVAACDLPSEAPIFQQTWIVPTDSASIGATTLLPSGVRDTVIGATPAFVVSPSATVVNTTLGSICSASACQSVTTVSAPTPAFTSPAGLLGSTINLPTGVNSAIVTGGTLRVSITNNLGFDPLRPNGPVTAPYGQIIFSISSGAVTRTDTIRGSASQGLPTAATTALTATLPTGVYAGSVSIAVTLVVPAGGTASLNRANTFSLTSSLQNFSVSQATIMVNNVAINTSPVSFGLSDVDLVDQVQGGGVLLDIVNPFTVSATLNVVFAAPAQGTGSAVTISKPITIPAQRTSSTSVTLTQAELRSLLGKSGVSIRVDGTATGTGVGRSTIVEPASQITLRTKLQLILNVGA